MARKKRHEEHVNHERWLVSYADFITLLFAFFFVMFAASNADNQKAGQVAHAVQVAFAELAVFSPSGKVFPLYDEGGLPGNSVNIIGNTHSAFTATQFVSAGGKGEGDGEFSLEEVQHRMENLLEVELAEGQVRMSIDERGLTISLAEAGFFSPGSAVLQSQALSVVDGIAAKLMETPYNVRVEGHTDDIPIKTAQFPSNWELSTSRATHVLKHLIQSGRIPPSRLSAVGYGEYRPVASNRTRDGRGLNRRVDIVVLSMIAEKFEPKSLAAIEAPPSAPTAPPSVLPAEASSPPAVGRDD